MREESENFVCGRKRERKRETSKGAGEIARVKKDRTFGRVPRSIVHGCSRSACTLRLFWFGIFFTLSSFFFFFNKYSALPSFSSSFFFLLPFRTLPSFLRRFSFVRRRQQSLFWMHTSLGLGRSPPPSPPPYFLALLLRCLISQPLYYSLSHRVRQPLASLAKHSSPSGNATTPMLLCYGHDPAQTKGFALLSLCHTTAPAPPRQSFPAPNFLLRDPPTGTRVLARSQKSKPPQREEEEEERKKKQKKSADPSQDKDSRLFDPAPSLVRFCVRLFVRSVVGSFTPSTGHMFVRSFDRSIIY